MQLLFILLQLSHVFIVLIGGTESGWSDEGANRRFQGRYTRDIGEYEVTIPRKVNPDGSFRSFALPHFYQRNSEDNRERRDDDAEEDHRVHYALTFNDLVHHLELSPNYGLLSPSLVIERRRKARDLSGVDLSSPKDLQCHYVGKVRGQRRSRVAISNCDGLAGYISTRDGHFFIEPARDVYPEQDGRHLHLVHRHVRDEYSLHPSPPTSKCGAEDDWQDAWAKRLRYEYKNGSEWKGEFKRSSSEHRFLELCIVADKKFIDHHKATDPEAYILTIMNMVSDYYHDATVGNLIDVIVVRIIMLEHEKREVDLTISRNAEKTLTSFAAWSKKSNPTSHTHPNHHDVAVLLTRHDICSDNETQCGLLGLAYVAAACNPDLAACINEDGGLVLSVVVTHEVGHVMGCSHDTEQISGCKSDTPDGSNNIMSPYVKAHTTVWSSCSRKFITEFLDNGLGECLLDQPQDTLFKLPQMPPGAMYDATYQCRTLFGPDSKPCSETIDCKRLWCVVKPGGCSSYGDPPAEGTTCAAGKWCYNDECVQLGQRPGAVDGGWGAWGVWSPCSRTCGGGVSSKERQCDNPAPRHLGRYCVGKRKTYRTCNTIPCGLSAKPFREVQCTEKNSKPFFGKLHTWTPFTKPGGNPCALTCVNEQHSFSVLEPRVKDGTPCKVGTRDMCVGGACKHVGCDWQLESGAEFDQCGICKGDGTQCEHIQGTFEQNGHGYVKVVTIPKGVHNVKVSELKATPNTIAVSAANGNKFYLNGQNREEADGQYMFGPSTLGVYSHPEREREELIIFGPTEVDLVIHVAFYSRDKYPGLHYEYFKKKSRRQASSPKYTWEFLEWGDCSVRCGGGTQIAQASCVEDSGGRVTSSFCQELQKPEPISRECGTDPCTSQWVVGKWSACKSGKRTRDVRCMMQAPHVADDDIEMTDEHCNGTKPECSEMCTDHSQECSTTCTTPCSRTTPSLAELDDIRSEVMNVIEQLSSVSENLPAGVKGKGDRQQLTSAGEKHQVGDFKEKLTQQLSAEGESPPTDANENKVIDDSASSGGETSVEDLKGGKDTQQVSVEGTPRPVDFKEDKVKLHSFTGEKHGSDFIEVDDNKHSFIGGEKHPMCLKDEKNNLHSLIEQDEAAELKAERDQLYSLLSGESSTTGLYGGKLTGDGLHDKNLKREKKISSWFGEKENPASMKENMNVREVKKEDSWLTGFEEPDNVKGKDKSQDLKQVDDWLMGLEETAQLKGTNNLPEAKQEESWLSGVNEPAKVKEKVHSPDISDWFMERDEPENINLKDNLPKLKQEDSWFMGLEEPEKVRETKSVESVSKGDEPQPFDPKRVNDIQQMSFESKLVPVDVKAQDNLQTLKDEQKRLADFEHEKDRSLSIVASKNHPAELKKDNIEEHSIVTREKHPAEFEKDKNIEDSLVEREKNPAELKEVKVIENTLLERDKNPAQLKEDKNIEDSLVEIEKTPAELKEDKDIEDSLVEREKNSAEFKEVKDQEDSLIEREKNPAELKEDKDNEDSIIARENNFAELKEEKDIEDSLAEKEKHPAELKEDKEQKDSLVETGKNTAELKKDNDIQDFLVEKEKTPAELKEDKDKEESIVAREKNPTELKEDKDNERHTVARDTHPAELKDDKDKEDSIIAREKHPAELKVDKDNEHSIFAREKHPSGLKENKGNEHSIVAREKNPAGLKEDKDNEHSLVAREKNPVGLKENNDNENSIVAIEKRPAGLKGEKNNEHTIVAREKNPVGLKEDNANENSIVARDQHHAGLKEDKDIEHNIVAREKHPAGLKEEKENEQSVVAREKRPAGLKEDKDNEHTIVAREKHPAGLKEKKDNDQSIVAREKRPAGLTEDKDNEHTIVAREKHPVGLKEDKDNDQSIVAREKRPAGLKEDKDNEHSIVAKEKHSADLKEDKDRPHSVALREKHQEDKGSVRSFTDGEKRSLHLEHDKGNIKSLVAEEKQHFDLKDDMNNIHSSVAGGNNHIDLKDDTDNLSLLKEGQTHTHLTDDKDGLQSALGETKHELELKGLEWYRHSEDHPESLEEIAVPQEASVSTGKFSLESAPQVAPVTGEKQFSDLKQKKDIGQFFRHHKHKFSGKSGKKVNGLKRKYKQRHSRRGKKRHHGTGRTKSRLFRHRARHNHWKKRKHSGVVDRRSARGGGEVGEDDDENDNEEDLDNMTTARPCKPRKDHKLQQNEEVEDRVPEAAVTLIEVPVIEPNKTCAKVFSDEAEEEMGDPESVMLDTKNEKVYHGKEAVDKIKEIEDAAKKAEHT